MHQIGQLTGFCALLQIPSCLTSESITVNNHMHSDSKKRRRSSFRAALLFAAGDVKRLAQLFDWKTGKQGTFQIKSGYLLAFLNSLTIFKRLLHVT